MEVIQAFSGTAPEKVARGGQSSPGVLSGLGRGRARRSPAKSRLCFSPSGLEEWHRSTDEAWSLLPACWWSRCF